MLRLVHSTRRSDGGGVGFVRGLDGALIVVVVVIVGGAMLVIIGIVVVVVWEQEGEAL